jgi:hypothetical protein
MSMTVTMPSSVDSATRLEVSIHADTRDAAMAARHGHKQSEKLQCHHNKADCAHVHAT